MDFGVKNIVVFSDIKDLSGDFLGIETKKKNIETFVLLDEKLEVENACFESVSINSITKGLVVNIENKNFFLATHWLGEKQQNQMKEILSSYGKFDVLFTEKENHNYMDVVSADKIITQYKITDENKKYKTSTLYSSGNFTTVF